MAPMDERTVRIHVFASVKGGVGKSSLAIACAKLVVLAGRKPVLIDGDMMGTSIADGLKLCAPKVELTNEGNLKLLAPPTGEFYTLEETRRLRAKRRDGKRDVAQLPPVFLNDILDHFDDGFADGREVEIPRVDGLLWRHEQDDGVLYLPSSALRRDVAESLGWIRIHPDDRFDGWVHCLAWTLEALLSLRRDLTDIVIDLPPGTVGLTHQMLLLLSSLAAKKLPKGYPVWNTEAIHWRLNPFLVSSDDRNDLLPALEYIGQNKTRREISPLGLLVNRVRIGTDIDALKEISRDMLGPALGVLGIERDMKLVEEHRETLGAMFRKGDLVVDKKVEALSAILGVDERIS